jgi:hypothetical protein
VHALNFMHCFQLGLSGRCTWSPCVVACVACLAAPNVLCCLASLVEPIFGLLAAGHSGPLAIYRPAEGRCVLAPRGYCSRCPSVPIVALLLRAVAEPRRSRCRAIALMALSAQSPVAMAMALARALASCPSTMSHRGEDIPTRASPFPLPL